MTLYELRIQSILVRDLWFGWCIEHWWLAVNT